MHGHKRARYALPLLLKKLNFSPVVFIQGARQTGKSFLVRELLPPSRPNLYLTLDKAPARKMAIENPDTFIAQTQKDEMLIIDEAQKAPPLFDSVKAYVDERRTPGKFILLGSSEFSKMNLIRESLTGRASRVNLFPLTLSEVKHLPLNTSPQLMNNKPRVSRHDLLQYLKNGGMPGIFNIRDELEKKEAFESWIQLIAERDALHFEKYKISPELVHRIFEALAYLEETSAASIAKHLKIDLRKIKTHLMVLETLFAVIAIHPHRLGTGKTQYFFCDVGFLNVYNTTLEKKLKTWFLQEQIAQRSYNKNFNTHFYYYRSTKGKIIDLVVEQNEKPIIAFKVYSEEAVSEKYFDTLRSFQTKAGGKKIMLIALTGTTQKLKSDDVLIAPWEIIA